MTRPFVKYAVRLRPGLRAGTEATELIEITGRDDGVHLVGAQEDTEDGTIWEWQLLS